MKPYNRIHIGDVYVNPVTGTEWLVVDKEDEEKLIRIQMLSSNINHGEIWKKKSDRIFTWRCYEAY